MLDTAPLRNAYRALLDAAATMADSGDTSPAPPAGEWNADQILAHVAIVTATTIAAAASVASATNATYDNRIAQDTWTIERVIARAGGNAGLRERIRLQGDAICALGGPALSEAELDTPVPTLLLSNGTVLVDQLVPLRDLITGLADVELPTHTEQLLALLPDGAQADGCCPSSGSRGVRV
ncbi:MULTISPECIES: hypothetical protein [Streptosporangium]|uniref:DinB-like domain-containing protein n=1 Tax=Streptosporangium brasiliense TaxID=47480 RepID=A0ABT9RK33_9ACTN|nr:hypothetical protein [Streptosporangium brasiliense]MDP9869181.1 hypothetical protein [Streptosporangium brasiliense]